MRGKASERRIRTAGTPNFLGRPAFYVSWLATAAASVPIRKSLPLLKFGGGSGLARFVLFRRLERQARSVPARNSLRAKHLRDHPKFT